MSFFCKLSRNLILDLPMHIFCYTPPSVGVVGLAVYVCTHPIFLLTEEDPDFVPDDAE